MDEVLSIMKAIEECPIENLIFCYLKDGKMKSFVKGESSDHSLNMALMLIRQIVRDQVNKEGDDPDTICVELHQAINRIIDGVKFDG